MLKFAYDTKDDIPDGLEAHYKEADGKYVLDCEGAVPKPKLDEFRKNNTQLKKDLEKFAGIDPARHAELLGQADELAAAKADNKEKIDELVEARVATMQEAHTTALTAATDTVAKQHAQLSTLQIDGAILNAGNEMGLKKSAAQDLTSRAHRTWKLNDKGVPIAMNGEEEIYGAAGEAITPKEWLANVAKDAPHLFDENQGGGGAGGGSNAGDGGKNPWKKETQNITEQAILFKADPAKARRLAAQAGVKL